MKSKTIAICLSIYSCIGVAAAKTSISSSQAQQRPKLAKPLPDISDQRIRDKVKALHLPFNTSSDSYAETYLCEELSKVGEKALEEKDYDFARQVYAKYLRVKPQEAAAQYGLGLSYLGEKRFQDARKEFERLASNSQKGTMFLSAVDALIKEKRYGDADAVVNALDDCGRDAYLHTAKSRILAAQGKREEAIKEAKLAVRVLNMNNYPSTTAVKELESLGAKAETPQNKTANDLFPKILSLFGEIGTLQDKPTRQQLRILIEQKIGQAAEVTAWPVTSFSGNYAKSVLFCLSDDKLQNYPLLAMKTSALLEPIPIKLLSGGTTDYKTYFESPHSNYATANARIGKLFITWNEHEGKIPNGYLTCYWKEKPASFWSLARATEHGGTKPPPPPNPDALLKEGEDALKVRKFALAKMKFVSAVTNWNGKHGQIQLASNKPTADRIRMNFKRLYEMQDDFERARYFELASLHQIQDDSFAVESLPGKDFPTAAEFVARKWQLQSDEDCIQVTNENYFNLMIVKDSPFFDEVLKIVGKHPRFSQVDIKPLSGSLIDRIEAAEFAPPKP